MKLTNKTVHLKTSKKLSIGQSRKSHISLNESQSSTGIKAESGNWCPEYNRFIDDELVNKIKPECVAKNNGCGNCPKITYRQFINGQVVTTTGPMMSKLFEALR